MDWWNMLIITDKQINKEIQGAEIISINDKKISTCTGCYNCWIKTPGRCVIKDDQIEVYKEMAAATELVFACRIRYGCYDVSFKTMLERCLPLQKPFLVLSKEGIRHQQRGVERKDVLVVGYGAANEEEKEIFSRLVERTSINMAFGSCKVVFTTENELDEILQKEVSERWIR